MDMPAPAARSGSPQMGMPASGGRAEAEPQASYVSGGSVGAGSAGASSSQNLPWNRPNRANRNFTGRAIF